MVVPHLVRGAELPDPSLLPPPAAQKIDFTRDVEPIFQANCFRCHGEEKTKSGFTLTTRERALKGGDNGVDIIPGNSAASPLIYYVARLVEDMEMPPGNRKPLTTGQVGVLRAWIDQGARWSQGVRITTSGSVTPALSWTGVSGDVGAFREFEGVHEQWTGGLDEFALTTRFADGRKVRVEGHALAPDDYRVNLTLSQPDVGFVRAGAETWRRYYDDLGGYNALATPSSYRLDQDLGLDIGRAWFDVGLTRPHAPAIVLGYEYRFRHGDKSTLQWGLADGRAIYPASKEINESVHLVKFDFEYDLWNWLIDDNARVEWYRNPTVRENTLEQSPAPITRTRIQEEGEHVRGANTFRVEKQLTDWWLLSAAHFYSRLSGTSSYRQTTVEGNGPPIPGTDSERIDLDTESHVLSVASSFQPLRTLSASVGVQYEQTRQSGFGPVNLNISIPTIPFLLPVTVDSSLDRRRWSELASLRFTGIPFTMVFAEARLDQEDGNQFEEALGSVVTPLIRNTDFVARQGDWRIGLQISQWRFASVNVHYRWQFNDNDYDHLQDSSFGSSEGYSAFIRQRDVNEEGFHAALTLKPCTWFRAKLKYEQSETRYHVSTDPSIIAGSPGGELDSGLSRGSQYSLDFTVKPWQRLGLGGSLGYIDSSTRTARNNITSVGDYTGDNWWARGTAAFVLDEKDDLWISYEYWRSDYGEAYFATGLPLGSDYSRHSLQVGLARRWSKHLKSNLRYAFHDYDDAASGGARSYTAHGVFASLSYQWD